MKTTRKLRDDLTEEQKAEALRIGSLPAGQRIKTHWSMRVEQYPGIGPKGRAA